VYARRYSALGNPLGNEFRVNQTTAGDQIRAAVSSDADGDFVIAWAGNGPGDNIGVFARRYDEDTRANVAGPVVAGVGPAGPRPLPDRQIRPGDRLVAGPTGFTFSYGSVLDFNTITLFDTYRVLRDGVDITAQVLGSVDTFSDGTLILSGVSFTGPLADGNYQLILRDTVTGPGGVKLDGNFDGTPGGDFVLAFSVVTPVPYLERPVNVTTAGNQLSLTRKAVASAADGRHVVVWQGNGPGDADGVFARLFNADGTPATGEFRVNQFTTGRQFSAAVGVDADGDFVVAWQSRGQDGDGYGVYARRYDAAGFPLGDEFLVNETTAGNQALPVVGVDADGGFVVAWSSGQDGDESGVYARRFAAAGTALTGEFLVNETTAGNQYILAVAADADGDFVIAWESAGQDGDGYGVYARRYDAAGTPVGGEFRVNQTTAGSQAGAAVGVDADGDFVIAWSSDGQDGGGYGVYARRYDAAGTALTGEFLVNETTAGSQAAPAVGVDADGDFVIAWSSDGQDGGGYGVYARRYSAAGTPVGGEFLVNQTTAGSQAGAAVGVDADGDFVVVWRSNGQDGDGYGVYARRFAANTAPTVAAPVPDQTRPANAPAFPLDVSTNFTDLQQGGVGLTYTVTGNTNPALVTAGFAGGTLTPVAGQSGTATITVTATDAGGLAVADTFTVTVLPTLALAGGPVPEFRAAGAVAGTLSGVGTGPLTFALAPGEGSADNGAFTIAGGTQLVTAGVFDFAAKASYSVRVRVTDGAGGSAEQTFTVAVADDPAFAKAGRTLAVTGGAGADDFIFAAGVATHGVLLNGVVRTVVAADVDVVAFDGGGGANTAVLYGRGAGNVAALAPNFGTLTGPGFQVQAARAGIMGVVAGGAGGTATLAGTAGQDTLGAAPTFATLAGAGYSNTVAGFAGVAAFSNGGADDVAFLAGTDGADTLAATPTFATLSGAGFSNTAAGFAGVGPRSATGASTRPSSPGRPGPTTSSGRTLMPG
jgi:hypothetical protein